MTADEVLERAKGLIDQRANYGEFEVTAFRTAQMQSILHEEARTAEGFCLDMVVAKLARIHGDRNHLDSYLDAIAYLAQAAAIIATDWNDLDSTTSR